MATIRIVMSVARNNFISGFGAKIIMIAIILAGISAKTQDINSKYET